MSNQTTKIHANTLCEMWCLSCALDTTVLGKIYSNSTVEIRVVKRISFLLRVFLYLWINECHVLKNLQTYRFSYKNWIAINLHIDWIRLNFIPSVFEFLFQLIILIIGSLYFVFYAQKGSKPKIISLWLPRSDKKIKFNSMIFSKFNT